MSPRNVMKTALPWLAFVLAIAALGYSWNWALAKATERQRMHHAFTTGTTQYIFGLCPSTSLVDDMPPWASDMRGRCLERQPGWGSTAPGMARSELDIEEGAGWQGLRLLSRLVLEISPGKMLSLVSLVVISLAGVLGMQQRRRGWLHRQGLDPRLRFTRGTALLMLTLVLLALSASLVLLDEQENLSMCQLTGSTYVNLLAIDARCSQQTMLLRDTQALLERKKGELDARARELEDLKREIASLGVMRDALGTFKTELQNQSESTQQLIMAVTGATLENIGKAVDPIHQDVKGLDEALKTGFKNDLRAELREDMKAVVREDMKALLREELKASLQGGEFQELLRREVRAVVREDVRDIVRGELREPMKTVLAASHVSVPAPTPLPVHVDPPAVHKSPSAAKPPAPAPGKR